MYFNIEFQCFWQNIRVCKCILKWVHDSIFFKAILRIKLKHVFCCKFYFFKSSGWASTRFPLLDLIILIGKIIKLWVHKKHLLTIVLFTLTLFIICYINFIIIIIFIPKFKWFLYIFWIFKFFNNLLKIKSFFLLILIFLNFNVIINFYLKLKFLFIFLFLRFISTRKHINNASNILKN
jgi:hypothetical protein